MNEHKHNINNTAEKNTIATYYSSYYSTIPKNNNNINNKNSKQQAKKAHYNNTHQFRALAALKLYIFLRKYDDKLSMI